MTTDDKPEAELTEVRLEVEIPEVEIEPYRIEVRCGESVSEVYEYGSRGSGDWTAWKGGGGYTVDNREKKRSREDAIAVAAAYVRDEERARLLHNQLRSKLKDEQV